MASTNHFMPEIQGVDLSNYVRDPRSYNPIVYIHKKFVPSCTNKSEDNKNNIKTADKGLQCNQEKHQTHYKTKVINHSNDPVVEQTIKFANIIPLTIPPSTDASTNPVYYNIKAMKNPKRKKTEDNVAQDKDVTYEKEKNKNTHNFASDEKHQGLHSFSTRSVSHSSQSNTFDDINENRSLCCSFSEFSEKKNLKRDRLSSKNKQNDGRLIASESFEALADQIQTSDDTKIKIHLMNEKDKGLLCESIRSPVIKAIQDCLLELHKTNDSNLDYLQRSVQDNSQRLEYILEKLTSIEKKVEALNENIMRTKEKPKVSKLEELEQDVVTRETSSEEEVAQIHFAKRKKSKNNMIVTLSPRQEENETEDDRSVENMDRGEGLINYPQTAQVGVRTDRPGRLPARFCWTDVTKQNIQRNE